MVSSCCCCIAADKAAAASGDGHAVATQAAAPAAEEGQQQHQQQLAAVDAALPLLLQHESTRMAQLPVACKLLCCSKSLAALVAGRCAGQLDVPPFATDAEAERAAPWLRKHAGLVRSLDLQSSGSVAVAACAAALVAAGRQGLLALQSLKLDVTASGTLPLLEHLPASRLTELELFMIGADDQPAFVACVSAALGRLTALRSLQLIRSVFHGSLELRAAAPGLSGLSALSQLTTLCFDGPLSDLQHAPPQLLELRLGSHSGKRQQPLDLRHLAAATAMTVLRLAVNEGDVLPPNLLRLSIDLISFKPTAAVPQSGLSALTQLTALSLFGPLSDPQHVPPQLLELHLQNWQQQPLELSGLTALTALTCVDLTEGCVLPTSLVRLQIDDCRSAQPLLPLVQLQQLQLGFAGPPDMTADQLRQLSRLTALSLH